MNPMVSVIIPTYGGDATISRAVRSVLCQNYDSFEVIVVDDNNPDTDARRHTEQCMKVFLDDKRVHYIQHEKNKNGSAARNTGFSYSKGTYICLLDDDDVFLQNKILRQVEFLESHSEFGGCYCWRKQGDSLVCGEYEGDLSIVLLDLSFTPTTCCLMLRRECYASLHGFDESYCRHQDFEFLLRFFEQYKIGVCKEVLVELIGNGVNNQPKGKKLYNVKKQFFEQFGAKIEEIDWKEPGFKKRVYAEHYARAFKDMVRYGNWWLAIKTYVLFGTKGGMQFWKVFSQCCISGLKERIEKR